MYRTGALTCLLLVASQAYALDSTMPIALYRRASWTEEDGVPLGTIWAITQDRQGYLWLGTQSGVIRFDGVRFVRWTARRSPGFPEAGVKALCVGRDGSLWIAFVGHLGRLIPSDDQAWLYEAHDSSLNASVVALAADKEGSIWAGSPAGLTRYRNREWEQPPLPEHLPSHTAIHSIYMDRAGTLWISTTDGVLKWIQGDGRLQLVASFGVVRAFSEDSSGNIWVTSADGTFNMLQERARVVRVPDRAVSGWRLLHDRNGNMWIGTQGHGAYRIAPHGNVRRLQERRQERRGTLFGRPGSHG